MTNKVDNQLELSVLVHQDAHISDFVGDSWVPMIDAVRQLHTRLLKCFHVYGVKGTGKSHFLSAICSSYADMKRTAIKVSLKDIINDAPADILVALEMYELIAIDDLQAIIGHAVWQEAVFHLYNRSVAGNCQLVFASDVPISALNFEMADLKSRIAQAPSFLLPEDHLIEERKTILYEHLQRRNINLPATTLRYLIYHGPTKISLMSSLVDEFLLKMKSKNPKKMSAENKALLVKLCDKYHELA